jgi:hypothetical protein
MCLSGYELEDSREKIDVPERDSYVDEYMHIHGI